MKYTHTRLLTDDFAATFRFYRDLLGLPVILGDEGGPYAEFRTTSIILAIFKREEMARAAQLPAGLKSSPLPVVLTFDVLDVDAKFADLKSRGATVLASPTDRGSWMVRTAHFADPSGNVIEINSPLRAQHRA